jgi:2-keto-4-pentenoate hydratase/2-oxohepta-3-ene-1,7-dioic acid hydratase in catechol pathway
MKLISFEGNDRKSWGVLVDDKIFDVGALDVVQSQTLGQVLRSGNFETVIRQWDLAPQLAFGEIKLLPPIVDPVKILCIGLNYMDHIVEMKRPIPEHPVVFTRFADTFVGSGRPIEAPRNSEQFDYEGELAVVLSGPARHVTETEAESLILGYSIINDGSVRDFQRQTTQFTPGKNFPRSGGFGPWIITKDELSSLEGRSITTTLNGEVVQRSTLSELIFSVPNLISTLSQWTELNPGDVIATGTPGGVGDSYDPKRWMQPGGLLEVAIDGIGTLSNPIMAQAQQ